MSRLKDIDGLPLNVDVENHPSNDDPSSKSFHASSAILLRGILQDCHCTSGSFRLAPVKQKRWAAQSRIAVPESGKHEDERSFLLRLKPGDTNTAWDYRLSVPLGFDAVTLKEQLRLFSLRCRSGRQPASVAAEHSYDPVDFEDKADIDNNPPSVEVKQDRPLQELENLFSGIRDAIERRESRAKAIEDTEKLLKSLNRELEIKKDQIKKVEERLLELNIEAESDVASKDAESLIKTLKMFSQPKT